MVVLAHGDLGRERIGRPILSRAVDERAGGRIVPAELRNASPGERGAEVAGDGTVPYLFDRMLGYIAHRSLVIGAGVDLLAVLLDVEEPPRNQAGNVHARLREPLDGAVGAGVPLQENVHAKVGAKLSGLAACALKLVEGHHLAFVDEVVPEMAERLAWAIVERREQGARAKLVYEAHERRNLMQVDTHHDERQRKVRCGSCIARAVDVDEGPDIVDEQFEGLPRQLVKRLRGRRVERHVHAEARSEVGQGQSFVAREQQAVAHKAESLPARREPAGDVENLRVG